MPTKRDKGFLSLPGQPQPLAYVTFRCTPNSGYCPPSLLQPTNKTVLKAFKINNIINILFNKGFTNCRQ